MSRWRVILTDSESMSGVAPVCDDASSLHPSDTEAWVCDCCPKPHMECWNERQAKLVALALNRSTWRPDGAFGYVARECCGD
jgi:hypothetical protein